MADTKFVRMRFTDARALRKAVDAYFEKIESTPAEEVLYGRQLVMRRVPPTPAGLARALGITTSTLGKYLRGEVMFPDSVTKETEEALLHILTDARMRIEDEITTRALMGTIDNAVSRQVMGMLGYNKSMDEAGEEANNTVTVVLQGATADEIAKWAK